MKGLTRLAMAALFIITAACGGGGGESVDGGIGLPDSGREAWRFVGRIDQDGLRFTSYGFLTHIDGVDDAALFTGAGDRTENTALFSVVFESREAARSRLNNVTVIDVTGTATVYLNDTPNRRFGEPATFSQGTPVATASINGQNILSIDTDNRDKGVAAATAEWQQTSATRFQLAGTARQLGREGLTERLAVSGNGVRTDRVRQVSTIEVAGIMTVTGGG
ncbi:MAG: hypothetical protein ACRD12_24165 [Acidimicrobiales bacterium]